MIFRFLIVLFLLITSILKSQKEFNFKFKKLSNGIEVKYFNKSKKKSLPKNSQRVYINYSLYHQKDTSRIKPIIVSTSKDFILGSEEILKGLEL